MADTQAPWGKAKNSGGLIGREGTGEGDPMEITTEGLIRWSGAAALLAGLIFAVIQPIHPDDVLASVTTSSWALILTLKFVMCFLFLIGITGLYVRQANAAGLIGLIGFILFAGSWALQVGFVFTELFVLPRLAEIAPQFVSSFLTIANGETPEIDIGPLAPVYGAVGILYLAGGLVFGIATVWAKVLPRWPALLLAATAVVTPFAALVPHATQRYVAIPMGIAFIWLGYALWTERRGASAST